MTDNKPIEAIKTAYRQIKEGQQLVLVVHPDDMPDWLALLPLGGRLAFAAVPIKDEESEHGQGEKKHKTWGDLSPTEQAGIRCEDRSFQLWLMRAYPTKWRKWEHARTPDNGKAALFVREWCDVQSRSEIVSGTPAAKEWRILDDRYREETRLPEQR